jgi:peptide/nickel transport system substrate-binding protein
MRRRDLLAIATALTAPRIGNAQAAKPLRFVHDADIVVLDPVAGTTSIQTRDHAFMVFDTLYGQDSANRPRPQMVAGHVTEDDGKTWKLTLREGLMFHDGSKVLARDVVASVARWGKRDSFGQGLMVRVKEISAPDDRTIQFRLKTPFPMLPDALGHFSPSICAIMPARLAETDAFKPISEMVGSGPFRFKADERVSGSRVVYEKFAGYVPRDEPAECTAGGKVVHIERVEWHILPDASTIANALIMGEVDWWLAPSADLLPLLRKSRNVAFPLLSPSGVLPVMRFNQLQPPFDNPAIRRAILHAVRQSDYMTAILGEDRANWRDGVGYFPPNTPMASSAGMENLTSTPDLGAARHELAAAGYRGERVVVLKPTDVPRFMTLAELSADLMQKLGMKVDSQSMDIATMLQRRVKQEPVDQGGWSLFCTVFPGVDQLNPAVHAYLRGNGRSGNIGWPTSTRIEELRDAWFAASDLTAQKKAAEQLQLQAFEDVPYIPLGQWRLPTAHRIDLQGILTGLPLFWNIRRG